jgi:hypothetical protein
MQAMTFPFVRSQFVLLPQRFVADRAVPPRLYVLPTPHWGDMIQLLDVVPQYRQIVFASQANAEEGEAAPATLLANATHTTASMIRFMVLSPFNGCGSSL